MPDFDDEDEEDEEESETERVVRGTPFDPITGDSRGPVSERTLVVDSGDEGEWAEILGRSWDSADIGLRLVLESGDVPTSVWSAV